MQDRNSGYEENKRVDRPERKRAIDDDQGSRRRKGKQCEEKAKKLR